MFPFGILVALLLPQRFRFCSTMGFETQSSIFVCVIGGLKQGESHANTYFIFGRALLGSMRFGHVLVWSGSPLEKTTLGLPCAWSPDLWGFFVVEPKFN